MNWPESLIRNLADYSATSSGEVCALIYSDRFFPLRNIAQSAERFIADPVDLAKALCLYGEPDAIFHSHPDGNLNASALDRQSFYYTRSIMAIGAFRDGQFQINLLQFPVYGHEGG